MVLQPIRETIMMEYHYFTLQRMGTSRLYSNCCSGIISQPIHKIIMAEYY
jgi:hypothetical protein